MKATSMTTCATAALAAVTLAAAALPAAAQDGNFESHFKGSGRGDKHSAGWQEVMKLKGGPVDPKFPKVGEGIERHVLDNGLVVYLSEDRALPLVRLDLTFRGGERYESDAEWGVASFAGGQMRDGGTEKMKPEALDDRLAFLAASISTSMGDETGSASLDVLTKDFDEGLSLFSEVVLRPGFDEERFQLSKQRRVFQIEHRNDNPGQIVRREFDKLLYGEKHPRGREMTVRQVEAITRDHLAKAHKRFVRPNQSVLVAVGDFSSKEMLEKIRTAFGGWEKGEPLPPLPAAVDFTPKPGVYLVDKKVNQSNILVGHIGINRDNPDRFAVSLMNDVLGGGSFSSRITERVRSDEGLAYSANSSYAVGGREVGTFQASVQTKTESTGKAIALLLDEIKKIREAGSLSKNEFDTARESTLFSYVFRFENRMGNVSRLARYELDGRPMDTDRIEFDGYSKVTPAAVEAAAKTYLRPDALTILVVGDAEAIGDSLAAFGPVTRIELTDDPDAGGRRRGAPGFGGGK